MFVNLKGKQLFDPQVVVGEDVCKPERKAVV
jgi:hypothetical protein